MNHPGAAQAGVIQVVAPEKNQVVTLPGIKWLVAEQCPDLKAVRVLVGLDQEAVFDYFTSFRLVILACVDCNPVTQGALERFQRGRHTGKLLSASGMTVLR